MASDGEKVAGKIGRWLGKAAWESFEEVLKERKERVPREVPRTVPTDATQERRMRARTVAMGLLREFSKGVLAPHDTARFLDRVEKELLRFDVPTLSVSVKEDPGFTRPNDRGQK